MVTTYNFAWRLVPPRMPVTRLAWKYFNRISWKREGVNWCPFWVNNQSDDDRRQIQAAVSQKGEKNERASLMLLVSHRVL